MMTMTSLAAQNQFGTLLDASQRQPVTVTRHGRPVAVVLSYADYMQRSQTIPYEVAKLISQSDPLRGQAAAQSIAQHLAAMSNRAADEGLSEEDLTRLLHDE